MSQSQLNTLARRIYGISFNRLAAQLSQVKSPRRHTAATLGRKPMAGNVWNATLERVLS